VKCPHCGKKIKTAWSDWEKREKSGFAAGAAAIPLGADYERRRPARDASVEADVLTPALQSLITGCVTGICFGATAKLMEWGSPLVTGMTAGAGVLSIAWVVLLREQRSLLWEVERIIGADLDGDGDVGAPPTNTERPPQLRQVEVTEHRGSNKSIRYIDLPDSVTDDDLAKIAQRVLRLGYSFTRRDLEIEPDDYSILSDRMLEGGLLRRKGRTKQSGLELTGAGRAFLKQYLT